MSQAAVTMASVPERAAEFLDYLDEWMAGLESPALRDYIEDAHGARHVGIFCVDAINGFCHKGPMYSERVAQIIGPIVDLLQRADAAGVTHYIFPQDAHSPQAAEFDNYPPHCIKGTDEARTVPEIAHLPFAHHFHIMPKNSIHSAIGTDLQHWVESHPMITHAIVVGDCTDICVYQLALYLKCCRNEENRHTPVLIPMDCVSTYDVPVEIARERGLPAHPADGFNALFLYSLAINGVRVVRHLA